MGTALFAGVSGLQNQQRALDVIGNNIANINTTGYRSGRVLFQDLFSATIQGASGPSGGRSGTNPAQIGLGVGLANIDINFNQGSFQTTGIGSDLGIQGDGFFVVSDGLALFYTRDGSFSLDPNGNLTDPATGFRVQGYSAVDGVVDTTGGIGDIEVQVGGAALARATETITFAGNLDARADAADPVTWPPVGRTLAVFDSQGKEVNLSFTFSRVAAPTNTFELVVSSDQGTVGGDATAASPFDVSFDNDGHVLSGSASLNVTVANLTGVDDLDITVDFSTLTHLGGSGSSSSHTIAVQSQDGFSPGVLESFNVGGSGVINGIYSNGLTQSLGQIVLGRFSNPGGLSRLGRNMFIPSPNSGIAQIGEPQSGGRGSLVGGVLEGSNVDLAAEFTRLIIAQRSFQANARSITTADTILAETVNLVR